MIADDPAMRNSTPCLIFDADVQADTNVVALDKASDRVGERRVLLAEATVIESWFGKNAYSDFMLKHGCRPDANQAAAIGRLIGARVKAADGRMYPLRNAPDRKAVRDSRRRAAAELKKSLEIQRLRKAIASLAANTEDPADMIEALCPETEEPEIREQLQDAVGWLTRFALEWKRREAGGTD
jgi:hypothetical protein